MARNTCTNGYRNDLTGLVRCKQNGEACQALATEFKQSERDCKKYREIFCSNCHFKSAVPEGRCTLAHTCYDAADPVDCEDFMGRLAWYDNASYARYQSMP